MRRLMLTVAVACVAAPLALATPAGAQPSSTSVDRWGSFFGDRQTANEDIVGTPTSVALPGTVKAVGTSNSTQYALLTNGTLWAWGQGDRGELGDGQLVNSFNTPVQVRFPRGVSIASIPTDAMPFDTGLAIDSNGNVWGWGLDSAGQLCLGNHASQVTPVELPVHDVTAIAGAGDHALYLASGVLEACGFNEYGDLGDGSVSASSTPVTVTLPSSPVALVASYHDSGALLADGSYWDWGVNTDGELGVGTTTQSDVPLRVPLRGRVTQVTQGGSTVNNGETIAMLADGTLEAWGSDQVSELGNGGKVNELSPITISSPAGVTYAQIACGGSDCYAIDTAGNVWAWGADELGEIGNGQDEKAYKTPARVDTGGSTISSTADDVEIGQ